MQRWLLFTALLASVILVAAFVACMGRPPVGALLQVEAAPVLRAGPAIVRFAEPQYIVAPGHAIIAVLQVQNAERLGGWELMLSFDPALVAVEEVTPGAFLASTGRTAAGLGPLEVMPGQLMIGGYSYGTEVGVSGDGALAHIRLRALAAGQTALGLSQLQLAAVQDINLTLQPATPKPGQVAVGELLKGYLPLILRR